MRIIAGMYRGRSLKTLRGLRVRPTSGRLRETLFDILGDSVHGATFVDGYAGTGAVGLEAFSRGAAEVFLIEEDEAAARLIEQNLALLGSPPQVHLVRTDVRKGVRLIAQQGRRAHFCFLDPPYGIAPQRDQQWDQNWEKTARAVDKCELMQPDGLLILQHSRRDLPADHLARWRRVRLLVQGSNALSFYRAAGEP